MRLGLEESDFLVAMAPNPVVVLAQELDNFDVRGSIETVARLKKIYALLGHEDNVKIHIGPEGHGYHAGARAAMFECFNRATGRPQIASEPEVQIEEDRTLWCTKSGQVVELKSRPVYSFTAEKNDRLTSQRPQLSGKALQTAVSDVLKLPARNRVSDAGVSQSAAAQGTRLPAGLGHALRRGNGTRNSGDCVSFKRRSASYPPAAAAESGRALRGPRFQRRGTARRAARA